MPSPQRARSLGLSRTVLTIHLLAFLVWGAPVPAGQLTPDPVAMIDAELVTLASDPDQFKQPWMPAFDSRMVRARAAIIAAGFYADPRFRPSLETLLGASRGDLAVLAAASLLAVTHDSASLPEHLRTRTDEASVIQNGKYVEAPVTDHVETLIEHRAVPALDALHPPRWDTFFDLQPIGGYPSQRLVTRAECLELLDDPSTSDEDRLRVVLYAMTFGEVLDPELIDSHVAALTNAQRLRFLTVIPQQVYTGGFERLTITPAEISLLDVNGYAYGSGRGKYNLLRHCRYHDEEMNVLGSLQASNASSVFYEHFRYILDCGRYDNEIHFNPRGYLEDPPLYGDWLTTVGIILVAATADDPETVALVQQKYAEQDASGGHDYLVVEVLGQYIIDHSLDRNAPAARCLLSFIEVQISSDSQYRETDIERLTQWLCDVFPDGPGVTFPSPSLTADEVLFAWQEFAVQN